MSYLKKLVFFILLHLVTTGPQINLDLTDGVSSSENDVVFQHDCLHVAAIIRSEIDPRQIISYCLNEWPSKWNIQENSFDEKFTFAELSKLSTTSEQLYLWSAPIDIIENYQFYLNHLSTSKEILSLASQLFYNCTSSTFGPLCQYSLDGYESSHLSLEDIIHDFYSYRYQPITLTCYIHLQCRHGLNSVCLDWRNICDGEIDCSNDGIDEKDCWQLQINECEEDEYRCQDGQCIPKRFLMGDDITMNYLVGRSTDREMSLYLAARSRREPTFIAEDSRCPKDAWSQLPSLGECVAERAPLILEAMFLDKPDSIPDDCWFTFRYYFKVPDSYYPECLDIRANETCQNIIQRTCPDILFIPNIPILFGHIYLAYTKEDAVRAVTRMLPPSYICYNDQLCGELVPNKTLLLFNNTTCRKPQDFPITFYAGGRGNWMNTYVKPLYKQFYRCNTIPQHIAGVCSNSTMYQCINSSKCISKNRIVDFVQDCDYADDEQQEVINSTCSDDRSEHFFRCTTITTKCINRRKLEDSFCDCGKSKYGLCDDEPSLVDHITSHISFPTICDGFTELVPINISGRYETDETECQLWQCNNTYTRCDGRWNCFNGADEIDCDLSPLLNCPSQHICVAPKRTELMCLSLANIDDGNIDCLDASDEPSLCRLNHRKHDEINFDCQANPASPCTWSRYLCDEIDLCVHNYDTWFCLANQSIPVSAYKCSMTDHTNDLDVEQFLCARQSQKFKPFSDIRFFTLDGIEELTEDTNIAITYPTPIGKKTQRCHRGFPLRVWLNKEKNLTDATCLCPPNFYGNVCQYQNQRVGLTVQFLAYSISRRTPFAIVISLIDDSDERTIHSYQQFTYLYIRDCNIKFNIYLLYSTRPKNHTEQYSVQIDVYEKISLIHRASFLAPVKFLFLPIQRVTTKINIPDAEKYDTSCSNQLCIHGRCLKYLNYPQNTTFCHCESGWTGRYCTIPHTCSCSPHALCTGVSANKRSICVCPMNTFGSRCLLPNTICQSNPNGTCYNGGTCIPVDENMASDKKFFCICPKSFTGHQCQIPDTKIIVSFHENISLPQSMIVHFIRVMNTSIPSNGSTFATISINQKSAIIYWSHRFHIAFIKLSKNNYYLILVQKTYNASMTIYRTINPSDRCAHISEVLNESIAQLHLLRRIKYYHLPCQNRSSYLSCFYDDTHFCLCTDFGQQRLANCFEFNSTEKFDCFGQSSCLNGAECLQDRLTCPLVSVCICPTCFYGAQCQFSSNGFGLSLDGILGYHIQPHIKLTHQPVIVQISVVLTIIMTIVGLVDGILSIITFKCKELRKVGCGLYLLGSSITTLLLTTMFALKFLILITAQINYITNRRFLKIQCISVDFLLRVGLHMDQWLNACVAIERMITTTKGIRFDPAKSKQMAKYIILFLVFSVTGVNLYDPFRRDLIDDGDDDDKQKRIWCFVTYSSGFHVLHSFMSIFHFFAPFMINIISGIIIIVVTTRQRRTIQKRDTYRKVLFEQLRQHRHLLIAPFVLIILAIPRLIISFVSGCMKSSDDAWLFLVGYFISFIPSMLTFVVFVLPSKYYSKEFVTNIKRYRSNIQTRLGLTSLYTLKPLIMYQFFFKKK